ncbi:DUF1428 domain-containing protein [Loktanella sp. DJP18]|uniref:DUF1428 domain-containing protein n=1 Tax=Loktanella sp. DJP18 TaxID=3409788 RepID=UPI003BB7CCE6
MPFCDITVVPVPTDKKREYLQFTKRMAEVYRECGASRITDYWHDADASHAADFHAENAMDTYDASRLPDFRKLAGALDGQTVVVSITEWPSRELRDLGVKAVASDPRILATTDEDPIFDGRDLIAGGFTVEFDTT